MSRWNVYVGCYTNEFPEELRRLTERANIFWQGKHPGITGTPSQGFERFVFDDERATLDHVETITGDLVSPQTVVAHPNLPVLYAAEYARPARLLGFAVGPDGALTRRSATASLGDLAYGMTIHPRGHLAYVIHWEDGTVAQIPLDANGDVLSAVIAARSAARDGAEPHQHDVRLTPRGDALVVADAGLDELTVYDVDPDGSVRAEPPARITLPVGSSPRKLAFHPSHRFVYAVGEGDSVLYVVETDGSVPKTVVNTFVIPPPQPGGITRLSELRVHPDGRTLYAGDRGSHTVHVLGLDDAGGVALRDQLSTSGRLPAAMCLHPQSRYLLVGNRDSDSLVVFQVDADGGLTPVGEPVECPSPCSMTFAGDAR